MKNIVAVMLVLMFATACSKHTMEESNQVLQFPISEISIEDRLMEESEVYEPTEEDKITEERVIDDALHFLTLIKEKEIETLVEYWLKNEYYNEHKFQDIVFLRENMKAIVELYHEKIAFDKELEVELLPNYPYDYSHLQINNFKNREKGSRGSNDFYYDMSISYRDGQPIFSSILFDYYPRAYEAMNVYLQALKESDSDVLASLFSPDDVVFPYEQTEDVLSIYQDHFDLPSLQARISGFSYTEQFTITFSDKNNRSHQIQIHFGDGLMGIKDTLIPYYTGSNL